MTGKLDAIIVGGGHNGLVAANYLARAGYKTLVLERRHIAGGACVTEEIFKGYKFSTTSYVCSLLRPEIIRDLELKRFGYEVIKRNPSSFSPYPGNRYLMFWQSLEKTCEEIAKFSKKDALKYPQFEKTITELSQFVNPLLLTVPPDPTSHSLEDLLGSLKFLVKTKGLGKKVFDQIRIFSMSVADYLSGWFESEELRVRLATDGVIGAWAGPYSPGTAYVLFHHVMGETDGQQGVWGYVRGGMGGLTQALSNSFIEKGGQIILNADVSKIMIQKNKAMGVVLKNGDTYYAKTILSNCDPRRTFLGLVGERELPNDFVTQVNSIRFRSGVIKINVALKGLPNFTACPGDNGPQHVGTIHIAPTMDYMEKAFDDAKNGMPSEAPVIEMTIPSTLDSSLAPTGHHVMSMFIQYAPFEKKDGPWDTASKNAFAERVFKIVDEYAPNFRSLVHAFQVLSPVDLENEYGLTGGNIFHGEMTLDQLFFMRPLPKYSRFRTPIRNLYLCGSGCHPGGGVMGSPGYLAARTVIRDQRWPGLMN